jgi:hypothetical protein
MNIEFLNLLKPPQEGDYGRKKKNRDELIRLMIHIYMEMSQGNSLYSYLKQTKMSFFLHLQSQKQEGRTGPSWGGIGTIGKGKEVGKG